jgi:DNA-binding NarL/FixJ family response regulator
MRLLVRLHQRRGFVTEGMAEGVGRLFVVHWHPVVLKGLVGFLNAPPDIEVVSSASTCEIALELATELSPDLVLMGYSTPVMGGIEATRRLRAAHPDMRVVLMGVSYPERKREAISSGALDYVLLETPPSELVDMLRGYLRA